jgi:Spy/CpxP family protein refolding chaperone
VPIAALEAGLKLTDDQKTKIAKIQKDVQQSRRSMMPRPDQDGGGPPDPEQMRAAMDKMRSKEDQAKSSIEAVLTDEQKQALPGLLKEIDALREAGIPAEVYGDLKLTGSQKKQLVALAKKSQDAMRAKMDSLQPGGDFESVRSAMDQSRRQAHSRAMALLTAEQRDLVQKYQQAHPRPDRGPGGPGGPEGFGPPPGGPDGPDGGPGGPGGPPQGGPPQGGPGDDGNPPPPPGGDGQGNPA